MPPSYLMLLPDRQGVEMQDYNIYTNIKSTSFRTPLLKAIVLSGILRGEKSHSLVRVY
jgi:hypothetical protein